MLVLPAMLERQPVSGPVSVAAAVTYRIAGLVCHQDGSRSFHIGPFPLPVCARCSGLYLGAVFGTLAGLGLGRRTLRGGARLAVSLRGARLVLLVAALPTAGLWVAEWVYGVPVSNMARAAGGIPLGAAVSWTMMLAILGVEMTDNPHVHGVD